jgi:hypothetical protein
MHMRATSSIFLGLALAAALVLSSLSAPNALPLLQVGFAAGDAGGTADLPVNFTGNGAGVGVALFRLEWDTTLLRIDPTDANMNGIPDAIQFSLPAGFSASVDLSQGPAAGGLLVTIVDNFSPLPGLLDGELMTITFDIDNGAAPQLAQVGVSNSPQPFFTTSAGLTVPGQFHGGAVGIGGAQPTPSHTPFPTPTLVGTPTITLTPTNTSEPTATPIATSTPSARFFLPALLYVLPPTATATPTGTPTATPTTTPTATATQTATVTPEPATATPKPPTATPGPFCANLLLNPGFEDNSGWLINSNAFPASYVSGFSKAGERSMRIGIVNSWDNRYSYSSVQQAITLPATSDSATLRFWLYPTTTGTRAATIKPPAFVPTNEGDRAKLANDVQMVLLFDQAGAQHVLLFQRQQFGGWAYYEMNLNAYIGQRVTMYFGVFNNGTGGITGMYLDEATLTYCD